MNGGVSVSQRYLEFRTRIGKTVALRNSLPSLQNNSLCSDSQVPSFTLGG